MTNISRSKTKTAEFRQLHKELTRSMSQLDQKSAYYFFDELFTDTEKIMIIKRFSALVMYERGYSTYKVWNVLHISPTTAQKLYVEYENKKYQNLLKIFTKSNMPAFLTFIDKLIKAQGKDRWLLLK